MSLLAEKTANVATADGMLREEINEIIAGLSASPKRIEPKYFYDQNGSELFDRICTLPEYYPTRTERSIMRDNMDEITRLVGPRAALIEFGAGSNIKARQLLRGLESPVAYVPVEISGEYLLEQANDLKAEFPSLSVKPVVADFTKPFDLPAHEDVPERNLVFFPGSTIGNFEVDEAESLLRVMKHEASIGGALLIGVDLVKDIERVTAAYNDQQGVTAAFNLNVLDHLNEGIGSNFRRNLFRHKAVYDKEHNRIEMRLIATADHSVDLQKKAIDFAAGEHIVTEYSHKYTIDGFRSLAERAGWTPRHCWVDVDNLFSVHYLTSEA